MVKSEVSHMISNDFDQSGTTMIDAEISSILNFSQAIRHPSSKVKGTSLGQASSNFAKVFNKPMIESDVS